MTDNLRRESIEITSRGQWLAARQGLITASIGAALFDRHPYITRAELAGILRGENQGDNPAMRRGRILESAVAAAVMEERPDWLLRKATTFHTLPDHRVGATPDYLIDQPDGRVVNVQCKTVNPSVFDRQWHGAMPLGYSIQVVIENLCLDSATGYLAVLVTNSGFDLHIREVPRHAAAEQRILDAVAAWWDEHDAGRLPAAAPSEAIAAAYDDGSHIDLSQWNDLPGMLEDRAALKATAGECDKRLKAIDDTIRERIGAARTAWLPGWLIRYPTIEAKAYTVPARSYRRLDVRPAKEEDTA